MSLATIDTVAFWVFVALAIGSSGFGLRKSFCIKGSHQRYVAATLEAGCELGVMLTLLVISVINAAQQDFMFAGVAMALFFWRLWWFLKSFNDDDHWFNDQWKRMKRDLKKLRQRLANASPLPMPSPA